MTPRQFCIARGETGMLVHGFQRVSASVLLLLASALSLGGCASTGALSANDQAAVAAGEKTVVLLQVAGSIEGRAYQPFVHSWRGNLNVGLGGIETAGRIRKVRLRFLSEASRRDGWTYFVLEPGIYYLGLKGGTSESPDGLVQGVLTAWTPHVEEGLTWRIDIPEGSRLLYVGSVSLVGTRKADWIEPGAWMSSIESVGVRDEQELARHQFTEHFSHPEAVQTSLLKRFEGGPMVLRAPQVRSRH